MRRKIIKTPLPVHFIAPTWKAPGQNQFLVATVLDLVSQLRDIVLMSVYLDLANPGGAGFE
jgi:hypothetical protein